MHRILFSALVLLFAISCSSSDNKPSDQTNVNPDASSPLSFLNTAKPDYDVTTIKKEVDDIKSLIQRKDFTKKTIEGMDGVGGYVYGYYYPEKTLAYIYSSFGAEAGRSERISYYKDGKFIYSEYRFYQFETDLKGNPNSQREHFIAEKIFYMPESNAPKDSVTLFMEKIDFPCNKDALFPRSQLPKNTETVRRTNEIKSHLEKYGK